MLDQSLDDCLRCIAKREPVVQAWVDVAPQVALGEGPLSGVVFGAKDTFETRGLATEYGSPLYAGRKGASDAAVILQLRRAGAILLGKTRTTPFASFDPAITTNPRLPGHTPGGSSAGSAAAVAAGMAGFALGTQTLGSVLRPASYCGVCGFKPTYALLPLAGVLPFAPSLDTIGFFTATAADMADLWRRSFGAAPAEALTRAARFRIPVEEPMQRAMDLAVERLRAGGLRIDDIDPPPGWSGLLDAARTINAYEGARTHRDLLHRFGDALGVRLAQLLRDGLLIGDAAYDEARGQIAEMRATFDALFREHHAVLTPAAAGAAPATLTSTGDPAPNAPWTALGTPAISIPLPVEGAPLGMQVTAAWNRDDALVSFAAHVELHW